jgi:hypothetical protein
VSPRCFFFGFAPTLSLLRSSRALRLLSDRGVSRRILDHGGRVLLVPQR